jgi:glyceraldehyde 3-phosphate dehydrogenase
LAPIVKVLNEKFGITKGFISTIHSYTNDQRILDLPHRDLRRARAAALNIIPTTTGAAKAIGKVLPELQGKLDGIAVRVPTPTVSFLDLVCLLEKETSVEEVNNIFKEAAQNDPLKGILGIEEKELVSTDFKGSEYSAVVDLALTRVNGDLVKVSAWYDNEWAYARRLAEFAKLYAEKL